MFHKLMMMISTISSKAVGDACRLEKYRAKWNMLFECMLKSALIAIS